MNNPSKTLVPAYSHSVSPYDEDDMSPPEWQLYCGKASEEVKLNMLAWLIKHCIQALGGGIMSIRCSSRMRSWVMAFSHDMDQVDTAEANDFKLTFSFLASKVYRERNNGDATAIRG